MNRREVLSLGTGLLLAEFVLPKEALARSRSKGHVKAAKARKLKQKPSGYTDFVAAAQGCQRAGEICLQHCLDLLGQGKTSMRECALAVNEMLAVCEAASVLGTASSKHIKKMAALCEAVCTTCEAACKAHENHHKACRECAQSCRKAIAEAKKLI